MPIGYGPPDADKVPLINIKLYSAALDVWPKRLLRDDGTPHLPASHALFHIVRWYMPTEEFDGTTKARYYRKRYKGDQLQLSAPQLAAASGLTVKQARDALEYLEHKGYINRTLVTLYRDGLTFPKSQFIALNVQAVIALSTVTVNDTDTMYKKAEENTEWDDDDYSIVPPGATDLQGIRSDPQDIHTLGASPLQDRPFFPQVIHHKSPHQLTEEGDNYVISANDEKPSSDTPPESVSPIMEIPELAMPLVNSAGALHNVVPAVAQVFAGLLPESEPVQPVKGKVKKAAVPKLPKPPKEPREMSERDLAFLEKITQLNPLIAPDVEKRLGMYRRSNPWSVTQIFLLTGIWPNKNNWNAITSLNGEAFDTEKLVSCLSAWTAKGWSPKNLDWVFNWYKAGGPPQYKPNGYAQQAQQQPTPAPSKHKVEFDDPLVIGSTQWVMTNPMYSTMSPNSIRLGMWMAANNDEQYMFHLAEAPELLAKYQATH